MGGSDYAHERVGAFMGLRICSALAAQQAAQRATCNGSGSGGLGAAADGGSRGGSEAVPTIGAPLVCCDCNILEAMHAAALLPCSLHARCLMRLPSRTSLCRIGW